MNSDRVHRLDGKLSGVTSTSETLPLDEQSLYAMELVPVDENDLIPEMAELTESYLRQPEVTENNVLTKAQQKHYESFNKNSFKSSESVSAAPTVDALHTAREMPTSTIDDNQTKCFQGEMCSKRCQICNDMASGFHYGVWSCEGCKAFFKRSLQGPVDYVCPATNTCTIDKHRRKSCQACRLRKCIEMGMNRGKKGPRGPRGPNKRKSTDNAPDPQLVHKIKKEVVDVDSQPAGRSISITEEEKQIHPLTEYLLKINPRVRNSGHDASLPDTERSIMESLTRLADSELIDIINWAKSIPGYTELTLPDRIHLLESSWMEILIIGLLYRSFPHAKKTVLIFAPDLHLTRQRCEAAGCWPLFEKLTVLSLKLMELDFHQEEYVLLRAIVLFNSEIGTLPGLSNINILRDRLLEALHYTSLKRLNRNCDYVSRLLLLLPHVRQCALDCISHMYILKHEKGIPLLELLQEMLESKQHHINKNDIKKWKINQIPSTNSAKCSNSEPMEAMGDTRFERDNKRGTTEGGPSSFTHQHVELPVHQRHPHSEISDTCKTMDSRLSQSAIDGNKPMDSSRRNAALYQTQTSWQPNRHNSIL